MQRCYTYVKNIMKKKQISSKKKAEGIQFLKYVIVMHKFFVSAICLGFNAFIPFTIVWLLLFFPCEFKLLMEIATREAQ